MYQFCNNFVKLIKWDVSAAVSAPLYPFIKFLEQFSPSVVSKTNGVLLWVSIKIEAQNFFDQIPHSFLLQHLLQ